MYNPITYNRITYYNAIKYHTKAQYSATQYNVLLLTIQIVNPAWYGLLPCCHHYARSHNGDRKVPSLLNKNTLSKGLPIAEKLSNTIW